MPIKYAIRTVNTVPVPAHQPGYRAPKKYSLEEVPYIVADIDKENGMYAVYSQNGTRLSEWHLLKKHDTTEQALILGRKKPGAPLTDSIGQPIRQGDYLFTHSYDHKRLELNQVVRNLKTKVIVEDLVGHLSASDSMRTRTPDSFIRIPTALIEDETSEPEAYEKRFSVREVTNLSDGRIRVEYIRATESAAVNEEKGCFGYFNADGVAITGWVDINPDKYMKLEFDKEFHSKKRILEAPPKPLLDALGTKIQLGDVVFSNDNHYNDFMLCEVIGFTKDRVRLLGYRRSNQRGVIRGSRVVTLNVPGNIVKFPVTVTTV